MTRPTKLEKNCTTGEETIVELNDDEIAFLERITAEAEAEAKARDERIAKTEQLKTSAKAKLVAGEPLTEEEASVLVI